MNETICAHCGKVIAKPTKITFRLSTAVHFDLCGKCAEILWDWLKKPKEGSD